MKMKLNTNPSSKRKRAVNSHSARHDMCWLDSAISDCREKEKEQLTLKQHEGTRKIFRNKHIGSEVKLHLPSCQWSLKPFQKRMKGVARWPLTSAFHSGASPSGGDFTPKTKDPACWLSLLLLFIIQFLLKSLLCGKLNPFLGKIYSLYRSVLPQAPMLLGYAQREQHSPCGVESDLRQATQSHWPHLDLICA